MSHLSLLKTNMKFEVDIGFPLGIAKIDSIVRTEFSRALRTVGRSYYNELGKTFVKEDAIASGETFNSFQISEVQVLGDRLTLSVEPIGDRAAVMGFIQSGRGIGEPKVPIPALLKWMGDRDIGDGLSEKQQTRLAFAIQKSIEYNGIEPRDILGKTSNRTRKRIQNIIAAAAKRVARRIGGSVETTTSDT